MFIMDRLIIPRRNLLGRVFCSHSAGGMGRSHRSLRIHIGRLPPERENSDGDEGLWGFNGILVGCAFPTFCANTWLMWASLIFFSMLSTWLRKGFNNIMAPWKINSLTFPFVFLTWMFLFASRIFDGIQPIGAVARRIAGKLQFFARHIVPLSGRILA